MSARFRRRGREAHTIACPFCSQESTHMIEFERSLEPVPLPEPAPADGWGAVGPKLLHALHHMHYCAGCGEGPWEDCEGGRAAWEAMAEAEALLPAPPVVEGGK